jgi:hypothetical protein
VDTQPQSLQILPLFLPGNSDFYMKSPEFEMLATNSKFLKTPCRPNKTHSQTELAYELPAFGFQLRGNGQNQRHVKKTKPKTMKIVHSFLSFPSTTTQY